MQVACGASMPQAADTVLRNGFVYTVDGADSVHQAVAVREGKIVYVGADSGVQGYVGPRTEVVDLKGRMLMPGLVDGHLHVMSGGAQRLMCSLEYKTHTIAQLQQKIQACLDGEPAKGPDQWLEVTSWDRQGTVSVDADPTRAALDALKTQRPILVHSTDHHSALTNSRGMALAGITAKTPDPVGGKIGRDAGGQPTGIFEDAGIALVSAAMPPPTPEDDVRSAKAALDAIRRQGVTTFMDAWSDERALKAFTAVQRSGELTARALFAIMLDPDAVAKGPEKAIAAVKALASSYDQPAAAPAPSVGARHIKVMLDGVLQAPAQTAAMLAPYHVNVGTDGAPQWVPGKHSGDVYYPPDTLKSLILAAVEAGLDPHVHAIGDRAVRQTLDAYEAVRARLPGNDVRPAIAHCETVDPADFGRFKALGVIPVMSFQWAQEAPYSVDAMKHQLGPERYARLEPEGSLHNAGARIAYGSDWPIDPFAEFLALKIGVTRKGDPTHPASFGPSYAGRLNDDPLLPRNVALRAITMNSAYQLRLEKVVGSIEPGKFADMIVLDQNFLQIPEDDLGKLQVLMTMVGGKIVYTADSWRPKG
ncbi:hydrolase [Sorangium cellulosum]|uniref:Hydrolase n=1 Tax=Sorangium cellulosum TaxID=56 RepID=A0A150SHU8_SORCE|nr:hydrolase [Sorangium cellulosum]KYF91788.1 hydrolase [Sorangium cellulosum]